MSGIDITDDFIRAYAEFLGVSEGEAAWMIENLGPPERADEDEVVGAGFDPNQPRDEQGQWTETGAEHLGSERDPGWEADPIFPRASEWSGVRYDAIKHSESAWAGEANPNFSYSVDRYVYEQTGAATDEYRQAAAEEFAKLLETGDLRLTTPAGDVLEDIAENGRFKSQFETATSGGMFFPDARAVQEEMFFGYPKDMPPEHRPIYGWVDHPDYESYHNQFAQYGNLTWHVSDAMKTKTTVTGVDSLSRPIVPGPYRNPGWRALVPPGYEDEGIPTGTVSDYITESGFFDDLIEAQYHGGLTLEDIEGLDANVFAGYDIEEMYDQQERRALKRLRDFWGVNVRFVDEYGDEIEYDWSRAE